MNVIIICTCLMLAFVCGIGILLAECLREVCVFVTGACVGLVVAAAVLVLR